MNLFEMNPQSNFTNDRFEDFHKFMDNLQTEVLQMEYHEFSKGAKTITEVDFARILLRHEN